MGDKKALFTGLFDGTSDEVQFERSGSFISQIEKIVEPVMVPDLAEEPVVDAEPPEADVIDLTPPPPPEPPALPAGEAEGKPPAAPSPQKVRELFLAIRVRPGPEGGIALEAPAGAAAELAALFEGMARLLRA